MTFPNRIKVQTEAGIRIRQCLQICIFLTPLLQIQFVPFTNDTMTKLILDGPVELLGPVYEVVQSRCVNNLSVEPSTPRLVSHNL